MIEHPEHENIIEMPPKDPRILTDLWDWKDNIPMVAIFLFLFLTFSTVAFFLAGGDLSGNPESADSFLLVLYSLIGTMLAMLIPYFGINAIRKQHSLSTLGLGAMPQGWFWLSIGLGIAAAVIRIGIGSWLLSLFPWLEEGAEELAEMFAFEQNWQMIIVGLAATFIVPLYEEIFFRGYIHNASRNKVSSWIITILCSAIFGVIVVRSTSEVPFTEFQTVATEFLMGLGIGSVAGAIVCGIVQVGLGKRSAMWLTILASSSIFGLFHGFPIQVITAFLFGLLVGWMYEKTDNLWPCIVAHMTNNGLAMGLSFISIWLGWEL